MIIVFSRDPKVALELSGLFHERVEVRACETRGDFVEFVRDRDLCALLADFRRVSGAGIDEARIIEIAQRRYPEIPVVMLSPVVCPDSLEILASERNITLLRGPFDIAAIWNVLGSLFPEKNTSLEDKSQSVDATPLGVLMGISRRFETNSPLVCTMLTEIESATKTDFPILLMGEAGVGKTYLARLIHEISSRRYEPFVPVSCGASPDAALDGELLGHVSGSDPNSLETNEGKITAARRGSLVLEEIDSLGDEQQAKLLRFIETGEFESIASYQTQFSRARLILTSCFSLQPLVGYGRFRPDLYYRLNTLKFTIPPLRHRQEDIKLMTMKFVRQLAVKYRIRVPDVDPDVIIAFENYPWPGNVRELEYTLERAIGDCREDRLTQSHLPIHICSHNGDPAACVISKMFPVSKKMGETDDRKIPWQHLFNEQEIIEETLMHTCFSRNSNAKQLGIRRVTLYNKMKKYGLQK